MKIIKKPFRSLAMLILAALLCCCADDREPFEGFGGKKEKSLTFSVRIPVPAVPKTYALNETQENEVEDIDILVFDASGNYTGLALSGSGITASGTNGDVKTFNVKVPEGTAYNMVILANCHDILSGLSLTTGTPKATVLNQLTVSLGTASTDKWNATHGSTGYKAIPMWGEIPSITVDSSTAASNPVPLTRMLSKIDVSVDGSLQTNFKLTSVRLYNRYTQGRVTPIAANWDATQNKVTAPSVLGPITVGPLTYSTMTTPDVACIGEIYTFEAAEGVAFSPTSNTNTCLVIGGRYGSDTNETFYRVDFANTSGATPTYLPLLRNHSYKVNIEEISASGYATAADAFAAKPINIKAGIVVWDDAKITKIAYDDQYILGVSEDKFTFTREVCTAVNSDNILSVTTDVPSGWKVDKIVDGSGADIDSSTNPTTGWLALDASTGAANATTDRTLLLKENTSGTTRVGFIHLSAGRLTYVVKVTQTTDTALILTITDASNVEITDLIFADDPGVQPAMQTIRLNWMPVSQSVSVSTAAFGGTSGFVYATGGTLTTPGIGSGTSYTDPSGAMVLDIQPTAFTPSVGNPFEERISKVDFTVNNGINFLSKSVFFKQLVYSLVVDPLKTSYYLDGSTYTFNVRSNANWKIKSIDETLTSGSGSLLDLAAGDNLNTNTTGGVNTGAGTPITFTVANKTSLKGTLTIVFESTDSPKRFNDVSVTLNLTDEFYPPMHSGWAGSNIYWDATLNRLTFDDVDVTTHCNYQGLFFRWGSLWGISPIIARWSDDPLIYSPSGTRGAATSFGYGIWDDMPYLEGNMISPSPPTGKTDRDRAYLYEVTDPATGTGDICKHMTNMGWAPGTPGTKWRMPTAVELEPTWGAYDSSSTTIGTATPATAEGSGSIPRGVIKRESNSTPFFPLSPGYRIENSGYLSGSGGSNWSATPYNKYGRNLLLNSLPITVGFNSYTFSGYAYPVRCVRE